VAKTMTKTATVAYLAEKTSLTRKQIEGILDETLSLASKEAKKSGAFVLPGFGKLVLANRKARIGRNPQTGEPIKIPAKRVCKFRLAKSLKDTVLGKR
jgi:DNA-binding protein HU-beta